MLSQTLSLVSLVWLLVLTCSVAASKSALGTTVSLDYGTFVGTQTSKIISFKGVRYADAPTGNQRFRAPVSPPSKNLGTVNASQFANSCLQAPSAQPSNTTNEDCLFGNVYVPSGTASSAKLPVVVYFHGGGFQTGDTRGVIPDLLFNATKSPFILTSFAYRLGAFGFLAGKEIAKDGAFNAGLLDQRAALRWVQKYIGSFGGDKDSVTIWGESAGAGATMFHLVANGGDNEGLFHQAMGDSPSLSFTPPADGDFTNALFDQFSSSAGCTGTERLSCLRSANVSTLTLASNKTLSARPDTLFVFAPLLDGPGGFLTSRASDAFKSGHFAKVPVLFGSNTDEGWGWTTTVDAPNANNKTVYTFMRGQFPSLTEGTFNKAFEEVYPLAQFGNSLPQVTSSMYGEARYICTSLLIDGAAFNNSLPSYDFHYDNPDADNRTRHGADLTAFFTASAAPAGNQGLFFTMNQYFSSFMTSGKPAADNGVSWTKTDNTVGGPRVFLHPGQVKMEDINSGLKDRCAFWRSVDGEMQR